mgnify:CR=1 FL=1
MKYIVPLQPNPTRQELHFAWYFTILAKADGQCQHCHKQTKLDTCHIQSKREHPELEFDPDNGIALCRSCHLKYDHNNGHRKSGRPRGYQMPDTFKQLLSDKSKLSHNTPEYLAAASLRAKAQWDKQGRKHLPKPCEHCGTIFNSRTRDRFCSTTCSYAFRTGKPRSGW